MSKYTGPKWKKSRRLGFSLSETGKELARRNYAPGQHGQARKKQSEYGLTEKQFRKLFEKAGKMKGIHGTNFMILLESRLDSLVYRCGFAMTRQQARQIVNHGHVLVNGKKATIPSMILKPGDQISFRERSQNLKVVNEALENRVSTLEFVNVDKTKKVGTFERYPEMKELNQDINPQLIVEFYSR